MKTLEDARKFIADSAGKDHDVSKHETMVCWLMNCEERLTRLETAKPAEPAPEPAK